ncbi:MAG: MMPL family transporter, partial [Planctomycetota bacterium]
WTFGIMGWCGIRINMMNCIVGVFVFGLVIDYAIFLRAARDRLDTDRAQHLGHAGGAVAISALTTLLGVGSLALASHPALRTVGLTAATGIACGWLAVLLIGPLSSQSPPEAAAGGVQVRPVSSK